MRKFLISRLKIFSVFYIFLILPFLKSFLNWCVFDDVVLFSLDLSYLACFCLVRSLFCYLWEIIPGIGYNSAVTV